jgi:3-phosphoshikimate 1-carboxyvinyltransferase
MNKSLEIQPAAGPIRARVRPPGSKSITNRALVCAALADGPSTLTGALESEDTRVMIDGLGRLGIAVKPRDAGRTLVVSGTAGRIPAIEAEFDCANSGTTIRFLTSLATLGSGEKSESSLKIKTIVASGPQSRLPIKAKIVTRLGGV